MTIIYWTLSWLAGIGMASAVPIATGIWLGSGLALLAGAIVLRNRSKAALFLAALGFLALGGVRYNLSLPTIDAEHIATFNGTDDVLVTGLVSREPERRDDRLQLILSVSSIQTEGGQPMNSHGQILLQADPYPPIPYGAEVRARGDLQTPKNFNEFDYRQYLARQDIFSIMRQPKIEILATGQGNPFLHLLFKIKARSQETINHLLPEPHAALLSGILLGTDQNIPKDLDQDFQNTGMTHIIAISGFNIAVVAGALLLTSRTILSYRTAAWVAIGGIAIYALFVGADAAVVRAAAMAALVIAATMLMGRPIFFPATIFTAALLMTLIDPMVLWNIGFQLSFAATMGLAFYIGPWSGKIEGKLQSRIPAMTAQKVTRIISDVALTTLAAMIMTLPIILYHFDFLSVISPLANLLILPAQPGVMFWGGLATILGSITPILGQVPAWIAWLFLSYTILIVRFFANLPITTLPVYLSLTGVVFIYGLILAFTILTTQEKGVRERVIGATRSAKLQRAGFFAVGMAAILVFFWFIQRPDGKLHVVFFDVGQGDATFIQTPNGRQMLVDGGPSGGILLEQLGAEMPFWDKKIDILVATHSDKDHFVGFIDLLTRYQADMLITNGQDGDSPEYDTLITEAEQANIPIHRGLAGEVIELEGGVRFEILHPGNDLDPDQDNNNSVALRLEYEDFSLLLTGDAEVEAERKMLAAGRVLQSLIYKAGHHGANTSSSAIFLDAVRPQIVIISAGIENNYGHPHPEMLQRAEAVGAAIWRTDQQGTIEIVTDGQSYWIKSDNEFK